MDSPTSRAKHPVSALAGPYGHPFHPVLVTVPIGAWVCSVVFDVASYVVDSPAALVEGARWLIAIGVLGALAAAAFGFLDFLAIPSGTPAHRTALTHMTLNLGVTVAYALNFVWRSGDTGGATAAGPLVLSLVSLAALGLSGWLGGRLAYHFGVRVAAESDQAEGFVPASNASTEPSRSASTT